LELFAAAEMKAAGASRTPAAFVDTMHGISTAFTSNTAGPSATPSPWTTTVVKPADNSFGCPARDPAMSIPRLIDQ
jgi:hypothetical protein